MRPSNMSCSISRRDPMPACANTLCSLGVSAMAESTRLGGNNSGNSSSASNWPETTSLKRFSAIGLATSMPIDAGAATETASSFGVEGLGVTASISFIFQRPSKGGLMPDSVSPMACPVATQHHSQHRHGFHAARWRLLSFRPKTQIHCLLA